MEVSKNITEELINFLESAVNSDWNKATESRKVISQLENEADVLKAETRGLLTKSLFLAVPREDILDLIRLADDIPNTVKDISGLMVGRQMEILLTDILHSCFCKESLLLSPCCRRSC